MDFGIGIATSHDFLEARAARRGTRLHTCLVLRHADDYRRLLRRHGCRGNEDLAYPSVRVLVPSNRIAAVTANAFATLNGMAPGRIDFGVGTGFSARRAMGLGAMKLADMEEYIRVVYGLLNGETLETTSKANARRFASQSRFRPDQHTRSNTAARIGLRPKVAGADGKAACRVEELRLRRAGRHDRTGEHAA